MNDILHGLNEQQRAAVTCESNVLQVLAPPGSGKTKTLTARVAYHIAHESLRPWNIIVCTFTIKAAREMKERIRNFVGEKLEGQLVLGTFHSVARRYLSYYGHHVGVPKHFGIADSNDTIAILKRILKKGKFAMEPSKARTRISKFKSGMARPRKPTVKLDVEEQEFDAIFAAYEKELKEAKLLDYDDLLLRCVQLLTDFPECVSNIEAVLIDEFQDTNHVQYELMNLFAQHQKRPTGERVPKITIVGDPDQSIYSFRSAEIQNLKRMQDRYPETQVIHLEENYRSSGAILQFATEVIEQDTARPQKNLQATHSVGQSPVLRTVASASMEAAWIVAEIRRSCHLNAGLLTYADYSILLRSASLSRLIETELGRAGIPYRMVGGHKFFDRVEVRILLDYLRVISQPDHNDALLRILNVPSRKLGDITEKTLIRERDVRGKSLWFIIKAIAQGELKPADKISQQAMTGLENFVDIILRSHQKLAQPGTTISDILSYVMQKLKYESFLRNTYKQEYDDRAANVDELVTLAQNGRVFAEQEEELIEIEGIQQQESNLSGPAEDLAQFLAKISLATDADKQDADGSSNDEKVVISTIHAAKGLEWPVVFIPAVYQGSIPHSRAEDVDEERRLLYVGMTRAKALLYLSWPKMSSRTENTTLSPFLSTPTVSRYHECRGPSFGWQVSNELAQILGRDCPSSTVVDDCYLVLGTDKASGIRADDVLYDDDENQPRTENGLYSHEYTAESLDRYYGGDTRKRKYAGHSSLQSTTTTTMTVSTGFVSAKVQLEDFKTAAKISRLEKNSDFTKHRAEDRKRPKAVEPPSTVASTQASITRFLSAKAHATKSQEPIALAGTCQTIPETPAFFTRRTLKTNSEALQPSIARSISKQPSFTKPIVDDGEPVQSRPTHILLSSSPMKPETIGDVDNPIMQSGDDGQEKENMSREAGASYSYQGGFQTSTSLHTTSMQKLKGLQNRPGARTKVNGRATPGGYVNKQFRPPTLK